jgi:hypothetical protein
MRFSIFGAEKVLGIPSRSWRDLQGQNPSEQTGVYVAINVLAI